MSRSLVLLALAVCLVAPVRAGQADTVAAAAGGAKIRAEKEPREPPAKQAVRMEGEGDVVLRALAAPLPGPMGSTFETSPAGHAWGISVTLRPGVDVARALARLVEVGARPVSVSLRREGARLDVTAPSGLGPKVVVRARSIPEAAAVVPWSVPVPLNDDSIWIGQSDDAGTHATPLFAHGLTGTGEVVAVYDTGMDPDTCYVTLAPGDFTAAQSLVPPDTGLVDTAKKTWAYYVEPGATAYDSVNGHGTAVAGCVLGDSYVTPSTPTSAGHDPNDGMAPNARLLFLDGGVGGVLNGIVGDLSLIFLQSWSAGARIENHSWGNPGVNVMSPFACDLDRFAWRHEDMLFVNANGNSALNPADGSVIDPAVAKNVLAVGATTNGEVGARDLKSFSSRGPAFDGRLKPEVVAPGDIVRTAGGTGVPGDADCSGVRTSGTSFASPTAAGWAALARQYHRDGFLPTGAASPSDATRPSAALVRATLVASAVPLEGDDGRTGLPVDPPPSMNQGFGRPLLDGALYFAGDTRHTTAIDVGNGRGLRTGGTGGFPLQVDSASEPLRVTLVWTDPFVLPGTSPALVNDLDLVVMDPVGTIYRGNVWSGGASVPGGAADRVNTVEVVSVAVPMTGRFDVRVETGRPLGRPGLEGSARQGFALVATYGGCAAGAPPAPAGVSTAEVAAGIDVSWPAVPGALGYLVYRADGLTTPLPADFALVTPLAVAGTTFRDMDVQCGTSYAYAVRAWNGCSLSALSPPRAAARSLGSCTLAPDFAGLVEARPEGGCGKVLLTWAAAVSRCPCSTGVVYDVWSGPSLPVDTSGSPLLTCLTGTSVVVDAGVGAGLVHYVVRAEDRVPGGTGPCAGGVVDGNLETRASVPLSPTVTTTLRDAFETGRTLWSRRALAGPIAWDIVQEPFASSAPLALRALDFPTTSDSVAELVQALRPSADTLIAFRHTFETEGRYDGGFVEISTDGGLNFSDAGERLVQAPRYTDWMLTGPSNSVLRPGYTGGTLGPLAETLLWLGDLAGSDVRLRFRMMSDASGARQRWSIDDVRVFDRDCPATPGALVSAFTSTSPVCDGTAVAFNGSSSYGGAPGYQFSWDFGDGSAPTAGGAPSHRYLAAGTFTVTLTVTDSLLATDTLAQDVRVVADALPPDLGNVLRAARSGADVSLSWSEPAGNWPGTDVLLGFARDGSDLATLATVSWGDPRAYVQAGAIASSPALYAWRVRLKSECRGTPGPL